MHISNLSQELIFVIAAYFDVSDLDHTSPSAALVQRQKDLRNLALVSKQFRTPAQQELFCYLTLDRRRTSQETGIVHDTSPWNFKNLLTSSPHIASQVRALRISDKGLLCDELSEILPALTNLTSLELFSGSFIGTEWWELSTCVQDALIETMRKPNLSTLLLDSMESVPLASLQGANSVARLRLSGCTFTSPSEAASGHTVTSPLKIHSLELGIENQTGSEVYTKNFRSLISPPNEGGTPVLSLQNLKSLSLAFSVQSNLTSILPQIFGECASSLQSLTINEVQLKRYQPPLLPTLYPLRFLRSLTVSAKAFDITGEARHSSAPILPRFDPLASYFLPLIGSLPRNNDIARIRVVLSTKVHGTRDLVDMTEWRWATLDTLLSPVEADSESSPFPLLEKFELCIRMIEGEFSEAKAIIIDRLPGLASRGLLDISERHSGS